MTAKIGINRTVWFFSSALVIVSALIGLLQPSIYSRVVAPRILPGVFTQDVVALAMALVLLVVAVVYRGESLRQRIVAHGILAFFLYAYGIYTIERVYTYLYPAYLAILGLSVYGLVYGMATVPRAQLQDLSVRPATRILAGSYGILIAVMFNIVWLSQLVPLISASDRIEYTYSVYVIDLALVMPGFVIASIMAFRKQAMGLSALPTLFLMGFCILSPLSLAELLKPARYGLETDQSGLILYSVLALLFVLLFVVYLTSMRSRTVR